MQTSGRHRISNPVAKNPTQIRHRTDDSSSDHHPGRMPTRDCDSPEKTSLIRPSVHQNPGNFRTPFTTLKIPYRVTGVRIRSPPRPVSYDDFVWPVEWRALLMHSIRDHAWTFLECKTSGTNTSAADSCIWFARLM
jgi:hypothetical protein